MLRGNKLAIKKNQCPKCSSKIEFISIFRQEPKLKGKTPLILGRYKCSNCNWQSDLQEIDNNKMKKSKNPVYLIQHFSKADKRLFIFVYTTERRIKDPSEIDYNTDHHLLTLEVTPNSISICPNVPFSIQSKRVDEGLMFLKDNKELVASLCSKCSKEQKVICLHNDESCKKINNRQ